MRLKSLAGQGDLPGHSHSTFEYLQSAMLVGAGRVRYDVFDVANR